MKKIFTLFVLLLIAAAGYIGYAHFSGGAIPTFGLPIGGEKGRIRNQASRFFEHVKFKNMIALKNFVGENSTDQEILGFMSQTFGMDPVNVDLQAVSVDGIELDSSKRRARAKITLTGKNLIQGNPLVVSKVIFMYLDSKNDWLVDIENISP